MLFSTINGQIRGLRTSTSKAHNRNHDNLRCSSNRISLRGDGHRWVLFALVFALIIICMCMHLNFCSWVLCFCNCMSRLKLGLHEKQLVIFITNKIIVNNMITRHCGFLQRFPRDNSSDLAFVEIFCQTDTL